MLMIKRQIEPLTSTLIPSPHPSHHVDSIMLSSRNCNDPICSGYSGMIQLWRPQHCGYLVSNVEHWNEETMPYRHEYSYPASIQYLK